MRHGVATAWDSTADGISAWAFGVWGEGGQLFVAAGEVDGTHDYYFEQSADVVKITRCWDYNFTAIPDYPAVP